MLIKAAESDMSCENGRKALLICSAPNLLSERLAEQKERKERNGVKVS